MDLKTPGAATGSYPPAQISQLEQVRIALQPGIMAPLLTQVVKGANSQAGRSPVCRVMYMKYEPGDYCMLLYTLDEQIVVGYMRWDPAGNFIPTRDQHISHLGMQIYVFPSDPWLPDLPLATNPQAIATALTESMPEYQNGQAKILRIRISPQRYRPGKRFTLRLDVTQRDTTSSLIQTRTFYGKVYHKPEKALSVYNEMQLLSGSRAAQEGKILLAKAAAFLPELSMILQEPVSGVPLENLMEGETQAGKSRGWVGTQRAAAALAAVHASGIATGRERSIRKELERFQKRAAMIETVDPVQGLRLKQLAAALPAWSVQLDTWGAESCIGHGDCKPSQFLIDADQVALLDFDHCGMADPANDVGTYLATLRQLALRQSIKARGSLSAQARSEWLLALEKNFLDEYCRSNQHGEGFRLRATWYEAAGLMRKALRGFSRSPFSPLPGAMIQEAWRCLETLPPPGKV